MADDAAVTEDAPITFTVKSSTDAKFTLTLPVTTSVSELKQKLSTAEYADTPADRQRLIYSGRVLKDNETLETYKIKDGHTIHLVKSAASNPSRSNPAAQSSGTAAGGATANQPAAAGVPTNLAAGTGNNPLAGLTGARYAGFAQLPGAGLFGPDGGMGPPPDSDTMLNMLENPQFQSTINEALQNPAMIDMMIQQNPMLRDMGPGVRQMMQSPEFRRMLTDPSSIRNMMQMQRAMGMGSGGMGGENAFPAPGVTNTTPEASQDPQQQNAPNPSENPTERSATADQTQDQNAAAAQNPFASLLNPAMFGNGGQAGANPWFNPQSNPFLRDPAMMSQMMQAMGGQGAGGAGANPMAGLFGGGGFGAPQPPDNRPPEERYADQLRQLNDMGFYEFERNIEALRRTGGSVQGAVEYLLGNPS
ncbi:Ubiquitin-like protein DskB [Penicillium capsulatum]|uniref:Ubiquitin-like protein DskB n=1 Tax=Penicillium capsulatum TaxID=69766 RepID=A0A9W9I0W7_9EURO|nr:Ubiquitin-like protein DskB [Penicillium capsulatum]KAJ6116640.1 Ubiquitin-like protein DskB [Penicillium capsulatum]